MNAARQDVFVAVDRYIAAIDARICEQVNAILHAPAFQRLEAGWRSLKYLADAADGAPLARIRVLPVSWNEVVRDLERASDFDQSLLFEKIYTQEFGTLGGEPFGLLVGNYEIQHRPGPGHPTDDVAALKSLSMIAAAAFAPIILGAAPGLFELASFRELGRPFDLRGVFRQLEFQRWQKMREGADMRFVGLALPRVLARLPYRDGAAREDGFRFSESVHAPDGKHYLWGNAAFAFASVVVRAFANYGWFADIRGAPIDELRGGVVADLPIESFTTDAPGIANKPSLECCLSDLQEKDLADLGFIGLRRLPYADHAVFYANQSLQHPARYDRADANANARLSCMLQYMLCVSRFAHYIKMLGRQCVGTLMTAAECEKFLQNWLMRYVEGSEDASAETKARYPLRAANVEVKETPGRAGAYSCQLYLRPHFQLDDIATGFRLTTLLAPPSAAA